MVDFTTRVQRIGRSETGNSCRNCVRLALCKGLKAPMTQHLKRKAPKPWPIKGSDLGLTSTLRENIEETGYSSLHLSSLTSTSLSELGKVADFTRDRPVHVLRPLANSRSTPNTYSGRYGFGRFPFHTDFAHWPRPPRYILLRCVKGYAEVTTDLIDGHSVTRAIGQKQLFRSLVRPRRPLEGRLPILRLWEPVDARESLLRWDEEYLRPASTAGQVGIAAIAQAIAKTGVTSISLAEPGDALLIDNWRILHSRSAVPPSCVQRIIERVYLEDIH